MSQPCADGALPVLTPASQSSAAPTRGPWYVINDRGTLEVKGSTVDTVAKLYYPPNGHIEANARLIAAAPDLLEALKELWLRTTVGTEAERVEALSVAGDLLARLGALEAAGTPS